jgi:hypothetical protein
LGDRPSQWRRAVKTGDSSFFAALGAYTEEELKRSALANLGWWHHSLQNTIDKVDFAAMPEGEARWMLETQLVRERNRLADVLEDCRHAIDVTLARLH